MDNLGLSALHGMADNILLSVSFWGRIIEIYLLDIDNKLSNC
jgi:hypothetical protein